MSNHHLFERYTLLEEKNKIALSETQLTEDRIEQVSSRTANLDDRLLMWIFLLLLVAHQIFSISKYLKSNRRSGIHNFSQVPCKDCRYFAAKNQYLKCAVRPSEVLTAQAENCSDYCSKHKIY